VKIFIEVRNISISFNASAFAVFLFVCFPQSSSFIIRTFRGINLGKIARRNSVNFSDILLHWRRIVLGINLENIPGIFFTKKFFLGSSLSRSRPTYLREGGGDLHRNMGNIKPDPDELNSAVVSNADC
jgi:hypothetical protein